MSQSITLLTLSVMAASALAAERLVTAAGAYPPAGARAFGATKTAAAGSGELVPVGVLGTSVLTAGAPIAAKAEIQVGTDGKAVTRTTGAGVGIALQAAAGDGSPFEALLLPSGTPASP